MLTTSQKYTTPLQNHTSIFEQQQRHISSCPRLSQSATPKTRKKRKAKKVRKAAAPAAATSDDGDAKKGGEAEEEEEEKVEKGSFGGFFAQMAEEKKRMDAEAAAVESKVRACVNFCTLLCHAGSVQRLGILNVLSIRKEDIEH